MEFKEIKVYYFNDLDKPVRVRLVHANPEAPNQILALGANQGDWFSVWGHKNSLPFVKNWGSIVLVSYMEDKNAQ
jgi:hypothetical protein